MCSNIYYYLCHHNLMMMNISIDVSDMKINRQIKRRKKEFARQHTGVHFSSLTLK